MNQSLISHHNDLIMRKYYLADYSVMGFPSAYDILGEPYVTYAIGALIHADQDIEQAITRLKEYVHEQIDSMINGKSKSDETCKRDVVIHWRELPNFDMDGEDRVKISYRCSLHNKQP